MHAGTGPVVLMFIPCEVDDRTRVMARIVVKCRYSGNYILTGIQTNNALIPVGGRVICPYCSVEHVWVAAETQNTAQNASAAHKSTKPIVRLAS